MNARRSVLATLLGATLLLGTAPVAGATPPATQCAPAAAYPAATTPVAFWSTEARCAIVPAGPDGVFGPENFGTKFPGEAAVYMGIVHVAIFDAAAAIEGGYRPYVPTPAAPADTSAAAAIATAAYATLTGLQPQLGANQAILDGDYAAYMAAIPDGTPKQDGIDVGGQAAQSVLATRTNDGRGAARRSRTSACRHRRPASGNRVRVRCSGSACPGCGHWRSRTPRSSGPRDPMPSRARRMPTTSTRSRSSAASTARAGRPTRPTRRASGPTTTCGSGTTACSASLPRATSTSCRPRGCSRWRTSRGATR